ncbi:hypothetical protein A1O7_07410 [Cladophialophora yegresii CBS 114405]|uniref:DUF3431 domain-containing protein n=1 Tax=Cladophialophora yegresii CBS 114405 TaxID=1182544 RepID=W9VXW0_9EURO|nr:uncharacterized protein A1O7_07410 [Cladophialophora yegresii CBS 114405]EXJ57066.1 hypothetical protein A1O7_07410 [Cladophialophora yegresii CBS 114405]
MILARRTLGCLIIATLLSLLVYYRSASASVTVRTLREKVPQVVGLGEYFESQEQHLQDEHVRPFSHPGDLHAPSDSPNSAKPADTGTDRQSSKPPGSIYTRNLVMAKMTKENVTWLDEVDLGPELTRKIYVADDPKAALHPSENKGHEVRTYLTYIIDYYDDLPDVSIFMHSHRTAWHNNELLNWDAGEMISRLSSERVLRQGYMNMRCHWNPGCPEWIHPGQVEEDKEKPEQSLMASAWAELFPDKPIPTVLAQPCCSQFALSRSRIRAVPLAKYKHYREWLLRSDIRDTMTGRIFEYLWQVVFTDESVSCPNQRTCYCDGYGVCFENEKTFDKWFELRYQKQMAEIELREWEEQAEKVEEFKGDDGRWLQGVEAGELEVPEVGKNQQLKTVIERLQADLERRRLDALERGTDPKARAESDGRPWKEGDGF